MNLKSCSCNNSGVNKMDMIRKKQLDNALKMLYSHDTQKIIAEAALEHTMDEAVINMIVEWSNNIYNTVISNTFCNEEVDKSSKNMLDIKNEIHDELNKYIKEQMVQSVLNKSLAINFESSETKRAFSKIATNASKRISDLFGKEFVAIEFE